MPSGCNVKPGQIQVEKINIKTFFTLFYLHTVCIPSCCIFSPDQGRATATISSRFGCMELSCHHQRTLSPMLQCCHFQHGGLGRYRAPGARPAGILGHSSHCKAQLCDDMQFCCLVTPVPSKARCQSRCASSVPAAVAITRSHASRETTPSAASLFVCVHCRRKICASSG